MRSLLLALILLPASSWGLSVKTVGGGTADSVPAGGITDGPVDSAILPSTVAYTSVANVFTAQQAVSATNGLSVTNGITASSGSFTQTGDTSYSLRTSSGINVALGGVVAPFFVGSGAALTSLPAQSVAASAVTAGTFVSGVLLPTGGLTSGPLSSSVLPSTVAYTSTTNSFTALNNFTNAASTQITVSGGSPDGGVSTQNGSIKLGAGASNGLRIQTEDTVSGTSRIEAMAASPLTFCVSAAATRTCPFTVSGPGIAVFNHSASTQGLFYGYNAYGGASVNGGQLKIGLATNVGGRLLVDHSDGIFWIENIDTAAIAFGVGADDGKKKKNLQISQTGVITSSSTIPSVACNAGTGVISNLATANHGRFTGGAASVNCTVTFATAWPKTPSCVCNNETTTQAVRAVATTTTLVCHSSAIGTDTINYICAGAP